MSTKERKPLLSDAEFYASEDFGAGELEYNISRSEVRRIYEAARAKDAELIQQLVDALSTNTVRNGSAEWEAWVEHKKELAMKAAATAGFTPTNNRP